MILVIDVETRIKAAVFEGDTLLKFFFSKIELQKKLKIF
jgi:hypothetical protein